METAQLLDETLLWLCAVPSPIGEERPLCDAVQARLGRLPLSAPIRRYDNSIVVPVTRRRGPRVALVGHLDTVRTENGPAHISGDRCFGSGASDMKSGLALMIALAETLNLGRPSDAISRSSFTPAKKGPLPRTSSVRSSIATPSSDKSISAVCMEPSDNKLHLGCVGSVHATVTFVGRSAHSARPWEGENAITMAADFLGARSAPLQPWRASSRA